MGSSFRNIRDESLPTVANSAERLSFIPPTDGYTVVQLDTDSIYIWNQTNNIWLNGGGLPGGIQFNNANKSFILETGDGLQIRCNDSVTQANVAGGFNGSGTGNAGYLSFTQLDGSLASSFSSFSLTALNNYETSNPTLAFGHVATNILANFSNGFLPTATDFVNLVWDNLPYTGWSWFPLLTTFQTFTLNTTDRAMHAVGGTGSITMTGNVTIGSSTITNLASPKKLTPGMYFKQVPALSATPDSGKAFIDGTTIVSVNVAASTCVVSTNSQTTATGISLIQYGGVAADTRASTANGTTTVTLGGRTGDSVTTTADLQVNMKVTGTGVPANSYIVSMVADTSITLNASVASSSPVLSFVPTGLTGLPANNDTVGIPFSVIVANNPSMVFSNTQPISPTWTTTDSGWANNVYFPAFTIKQGGTGGSNRGPNLSTYKRVILNGIIYNFGH